MSMQSSGLGIPISGGFAIRRFQKLGVFNVHDYSFITFLTHFRPSASVTLTK